MHLSVVRFGMKIAILQKKKKTEISIPIVPCRGSKRLNAWIVRRTLRIPMRKRIQLAILFRKRIFLCMCFFILVNKYYPIHYIDLSYLCKKFYFLLSLVNGEWNRSMEIRFFILLCDPAFCYEIWTPKRRILTFFYRKTTENQDGSIRCWCFFSANFR